MGREANKQTAEIFPRPESKYAECTMYATFKISIYFLYCSPQL